MDSSVIGEECQHSSGPMRRSKHPAEDSNSLGKQPGKSHRAGQTTASLDPGVTAEEIVQGWRGSNRYLIEACYLIERAAPVFQDDAEASDVFLDRLVSGGILPPRERELGFSSPKLSKLRKIGSYRDLLLSETVFYRLGDGYSVICQFLIAREALSGTQEEKTTEVFSRIERLGGDFCRDTLIEITREIKAEKKAARADVLDTGARREKLIQEGKRFQLAAFTPSSQQLAILDGDYGEDTLSRCLTISKLLAPDAVGVVSLPVHALHVAAPLLALCGFDKRYSVLLARRPGSPDISKERALVISRRGSGTPPNLPESFPTTGDDNDSLALAASLLPNVSERLHVFAQSHTVGWESIIGDDSWTELPSVS
jgi:hypothetical protein